MISAVITTKNEERNIERCIQSLSFANEIIVVDDNSTDQTIAKAKRLGARIVHNEWRGYGSQKNAGLTQAQHDWVVCIDADEEVSPELAGSIQAAVENPTHDVYWMPVLDIFLGRPLHHLTGNNPRLFRKSKAQWTERRVHEQVALLGAIPDSDPGSNEGRIVRLGDDKSGVLKGFLIHHGHATVGSYLTKMHRYTKLDAEQMVQTGKHRSGRNIQSHTLLPLQLAARQFVKLAFWRGGLLDGFAGFMWCWLSSYYEWEMGRKYLHLQV